MTEAHEGSRADEPVLAEALRRHLRDEAPRRERAIARFWAIAALIQVPLLLGPALTDAPRFGYAGMTIQLCFFLYEGAVLLRLRRGWFHPALPLVNTLVEAL